MYKKLLKFMDFIEKKDPVLNGIYTFSYLDYEKPLHLFQIFFHDKINVDNKYVFFELLNDYNPNIIKEIEKIIKNYYDIFYKSSLLNSEYKEKYSDNLQFIKFKKEFNYFINPAFIKLQKHIESKNIIVNFELVKKDGFKIETIITLPFSKKLDLILRLKDYTEEESIKNKETLMIKFKNKIREQINSNYANEKITKSKFKNIETDELINRFRVSKILEY